ncbi:T9SS type A sorting domain-containing protein [Niastella populi]|uniref:Secretion system C-terminal sorting domain-containing protein n=1 Tax=Niastella populi TaxID=550983 RepID=A0A1V9EKE6_9BACT|nr:T9SS type A sorting domain-containing protein [Niastella populi]OQP46609.1 hypothetical protein A4R26_07735 [Niastella populi]
MNFKFYPLRALLFTLLLFGFEVMQAQDIIFSKTVENFTTGGDGTTAGVGDELIYRINITNMTAQNFVACRMYDNIPAGVSYIPNSTTMNGAPFADVSGRMPFAASGSYVRSPTFGVGILAPGVSCTVVFRVLVTANGGSVFNNATIDATQNGVATIQATNTVVTNLSQESACNIIYQVTPSNTSSGSFNYIRSVNTSNGQGTGTVYNGTSMPQRDAFTDATISHFGGSGVDLLSNSAAIAYDVNTNRIYFVNNTSSSAATLCYVDLNFSAGRVYRFTGYPLETTTGNDWNVNRMGFGSDGFCYALTSNCQDFIKFYVDASNVPHITRMGPLINAATNGSRDVLNDGGGDLFADGSGKLYMIANSGNMYKINPTTKVATFMGTVGSYAPGNTAALAINAAGQVYIGGVYNDVYRIDLGAMQATKVNASTTNVYHAGDYSSCGFPVLASSIIADKTYHNINGSPTVNGGDTVEYVITVTNIGNINAAGVYMYDYIPPSTTYLPGTTRLNNIPVADAAGGVMPYAVSGGRLVNTLGEDGGIVKPGAVNAAVVTFRVATQPNVQVCNQSRITLLDADGNVMFVNSSDPTNIGQTPTCFYSDGVLPLNNLKFKGSLNDNKSVLNWTMNGDESVAYYEVEYSDNGTAFKASGKVAGKGTNLVTANSYQFVDLEHTFAPVRYYRLKVYQKGGSFNYSGIIRLNANDLTVEATPNPFERDINVQIRLKTSEQVRIRLINILGKEVYTTTEQLSVGSHSVLIRVPAGLAKGMYVLDVKAGSEQVYQKKLLKK